MARRWSALLGLGCLLACAPSAHAGLYSSAEPFDRTLNPDFRQFRETLIKLWNLENPDPKLRPPLGNRYQEVKKQVERGLPGNLSVGERLDLGAALVRLKMYDQAIQVMKPGELQDRGNFLLLSNLATAYFLAGREAQAVDAVGLARGVWPSTWAKLSSERRLLLSLQMGWDETRFAWYRKAEKYYQKLLLLRMREALRRANETGRPSVALDALFDVRFVGAGGKYEAGKIAKAERDKLPPDAVKIVEQLLVWLPGDVRLYWLLGELYNARGDAATAVGIFDNLIGYNGRIGRPREFPELREHRSILQARPVVPAATVGSNLPPAPPPPDPGAKKADGSAGWAPSPWRTLGIGFLAGLLVALLGTWQVREIVRRRTFVPRP